MKIVLALLVISLSSCADSAVAGTGNKSALDNNPDLFTLVTPDRLLGTTTRRRWLDLYPVNGREYWAAWDCKGKTCDSKARARIRATAKLVPRTDRDPKPLDAAEATDRLSGG